MQLARLVTREMRYRKLDFALGVLAMVAAVACLVSVMTLLRAHGQRIEDITAEKESSTLDLMRQVQDDYRVITKNLGYNLLILHKDQDLADFYAKGYASQLMPESFTTALTQSSMVMVQHLLPTLHQNVTWPEYDNRPIVLVGVRGEVHHLQSNRKAPLLEPVERGTMRIGRLLHETLGLKEGDEATLMGRRFKVAEVRPLRGNSDDITVWLHLDEAQGMLKLEDQVNAIMALSCVCAGSDLDGIRQEITRVLPETQVIQLAPQAETRLDARARAKELGDETTNAELAHHARLRQEREALAAWLIPLVITGCAVWVGLLAFGNVRERRPEIAILRALGFRSVQIFAVFLTKALVLGLLGAVIGFGLGLAIGAGWSASEGVPVSFARLPGLVDPRLLLLVLVCAPCLAVVASWIPAVLAAQQDPAAILREE